MKENQIMKNNIVIRLEEKSEYRKVENLVRDSFGFVLNLTNRIRKRRSASFWY